MSISLPLATVTTVKIGFVPVPVAAQMSKAHRGYPRYNTGFAAGIIGALAVAVYKPYQAVEIRSRKR